MKNVSIIPTHQYCFACGRQNESGLHLVFESNDNEVMCRTTLAPKYQGYEGIVHGGIIASIADATMVNLAYRTWGGRPLTCRLEVTFRRSVRVGEEIAAEARLVRMRHQMAWIACRVSVGESLCAEGTSVFKIERTGR